MRDREIVELRRYMEEQRELIAKQKLIIVGQEASLTTYRRLETTEVCVHGCLPMYVCLCVTVHAYCVHACMCIWRRC